MPTDMVTATSGGLQSNTVSVTWIAPTTPLTSSPVTAQFFTADGTGAFNTPGTQLPLFTQTFPNIDFNPAQGSVAGNTSAVTNQTRPLTDVFTDQSGNYLGTMPAQSDPYQAGAGPLYNFSAVFSGAFNVPSAGPVTFTFTSDDGFIFGVGNGATATTGPRTNTPAATPFRNYPVMGGLNQRMPPSSATITVNFPAAGVYGPWDRPVSEVWHSASSCRHQWIAPRRGWRPHTHVPPGPPARLSFQVRVRERRCPP